MADDQEQPAPPPAAANVTEFRNYILSVPRNQISRAFAKISKYSKENVFVILAGEYPPGMDFNVPPGEPVKITPDAAWKNVAEGLVREVRGLQADIDLLEITSDELARRNVYWKISSAAGAALAFGLGLAIGV